MGSRNSRYGGYSRDRYGSEVDIASTLEEILIMIMIIIIAAIIRLWRINDWSFWEDEIFTVQDAQNYPNTVTANPIIYMIVRFFINHYGLSEWSARLGPCIIGVLSVPTLYILAKRIFNSRVAMLTCIFLVIHPWHIYWSQNVRAYSLAFFVSSLAAISFYLSLERDSFKLAITSLILTIVAILSYSQAILLVPAFFTYIVVLILVPFGLPRGMHGKNFFVFFGPFFLALLLLLSPSVRGYLFSGWGLSELGRSPLYILFTLVYGLGIPMSVGAFVGGLYSLSFLSRAGLFLVCYAGVPLFIILIASPFLNIAGYYLFFTMPAYVILAALCSADVARIVSRGSKAIALSVTLIILVALLSQSYMYFTTENGGRPKWREAYQAMKPELEWNLSGATLVVSLPRVAEYYIQDIFNNSPPQDISIIQLEDVISQTEGLKDSWITNNQAVWFILDQLSLDVHDSSHKFRKWIYANCQMVNEFPVYARTRDRTIRIWKLQNSG